MFKFSSRILSTLFNNTSYPLRCAKPLYCHTTKVATEQELLQLFRKSYSNKPKRTYSFYCSDYDRIIVDEHLMLIPADDRMATRAHAVFDTIYIKNKKIINVRADPFLIKNNDRISLHYSLGSIEFSSSSILIIPPPYPIQMKAHIERLLKSAKTLAIESPLTASEIQSKIMDMTRVSFNQFRRHGTEQDLTKAVFGLRINISSGYGDFGISSLGKKAVFYAAVFEPFFDYNKEKNGVNEFIVKEVNSLISEFVHSKTVNYAENAIMANEAKSRGGYQGIKCTKDKIILEASVANVGFIFGRQFATPRLETVIEGTTLKKLLAKLSSMVEEGLLDKISFRDITVAEAQKADEMMVIGGDKVVPVLNLNYKPISKVKGPLTSILQQWYQSAILQGTPVEE